MRALSILVSLVLVACSDPLEPPEKQPEGPAEPPPATEGVETVTNSWDVDMFTMYPSPRIDRFDTQGGTRQLDKMIIEVDHDIEIDVALRNGGPMAVSADDYMYDIYFLTIIQLGETPENDDGSNSPPFFGPGGFYAGPIGVDLAADDGDDSGGDDQWEGSFDDSIEFEAIYDWDETPEFMEAMSGEGDLLTVVGGFSEQWFQWLNDLGPEAIMYGEITGMRYSGTMTIHYEWSLVE